MFLNIQHLLSDNLKMNFLAGSINKSLMILNICLEILRENQTLGTKRLVPYRVSKLTYFLKNFFETESCVHALLCLNLIDDETIVSEKIKTPDIYVWKL
jgi:kinesin family protein 23